MWEIEYGNSTRCGFEEWWDVTDGDRYFRCYYEEDAEFLLSVLTRLGVETKLTRPE